jgi:hypothetical protein
MNHNGRLWTELFDVTPEANTSGQYGRGFFLTPSLIERERAIKLAVVSLVRADPKS